MGVRKQAAWRGGTSVWILTFNKKILGREGGRDLPNVKEQHVQRQRDALKPLNCIRKKGWFSVL